MKRRMKEIVGVFSALGMAMLISGTAPDTALAADINLTQAVAVANAAFARASAIGIPMDIAVVDRGGRLRIFARMDGAWLGSVDIAQAKAFTANAFCNDNPATACFNTSQLQAAVQPGGSLFGLQSTNRKDGIVAFPGGVTICLSGSPIGALGVSGGTVAQDQDVAATAASTTGLTCPGQ